MQRNDWAAYNVRKAWTGATTQHAATLHIALEPKPLRCAVPNKQKRQEVLHSRPGQGTIDTLIKDMEEHWVSTRSEGGDKGVVMLIETTPMFYDRMKNSAKQQEENVYYIRGFSLFIFFFPFCCSFFTGCGRGRTRQRCFSRKPNIAVSGKTVRPKLLYAVLQEVPMSHKFASLIRTT